ncbi:MAG: hypothetical protein GWN58_28085 [Anaerolineae bacterium]|nr:hypothetical protein [Anaerolineae bacterium]
MQSLGVGGTPGHKAGVAAGVGFGEAFGRGLAESLGISPEDPEITAAKKDAALLNQINAIEGDPSSGDYAREAARLAQQAGRSDLAFQFSQQAGERDKAAAKVAAAAQQEEIENFRAGFNALGRTGKLSMLAADDSSDTLTKLGISTGDHAAMQEDARGMLETIKLQNANELNKIKPFKDAPKSTEQDTENNSAQMHLLGYDWSINPWNPFGEDEWGGLVTVVSDQLKAEEARANRLNVPYSRSPKSLMDDLVKEGALEIQDDLTINSFDATKAQAVFDRRLSVEPESPGTGATPPERTFSAREQQALDWANANPNDPRAAQIKQKLGL